MKVKALSFAEFYRAVHGGRDPFPWQERLAALAIAGKWPEAIAIPTGCGKTSVIDVAVYALAAQAGSAARTAPMRIFFIVDRRLVVDDVHRHAEDLARAIAEKDGTLWIREQLCSYGGARPLDVAVLRGGMYRNESWADAPNQPLVCVSTVDQVGSRLLFRGYGISELRRPVDAGLAGNDSLLIIDEAHLSKPFLDTLEWVRRYQGEAWLEEAAAPGLRFVRMSATVEGAFGLAPDDLECESLKPRLEAKKWAELKDATGLTEGAAEEARRLRKAGASIVGVVLNTVAAARKAFVELGAEDKILLTGRTRPYDRDRLLNEYRERIRAGRKPRGGAPLFIVATQTVEVGADLDFDALVTEAAPLDCLRQRFGRLDRLGERETSHAVILKLKRAKEKDWVYGEVTEKAWAWLKERGSPVDFGIQALPAWPDDLNSEREEGPLLFPAHLDAWVQTSPAPAEDPDVAPFLHGPGALESADVQIVWRADLPERVEGWTGVLEEVPPLSTEALPVPIHAARRWLAGKGGGVTDIEGVRSEEEPGSEEARPFLIWRGPEKSQRGTGRRLRPGDTIVARSEEGGCDRFGWDPQATAPVRDIGDDCANMRAASGGGRFRLRVHPKVWRWDEAGQGEAPVSPSIEELLASVERDDEEAEAQLEELVKTRLAKEWNWHGDLKRAENYGAGNALLWESRRRKRRGSSESDETDEGDRSSMTERVTLSCHTKGVKDKAALFTSKIGLDGKLSQTIVTAAELHDLGKCDLRFQLKLGNTRPEPWAKSEPKRRYGHEFPEGARHEFASVALAEAGARWPEGCDTDLALHLIGTHHGFGRPFPPVWRNGDYEIEAQMDGRSVVVRDVYKIASLDSGWTERFWRLVRRYGWWGLAYLEAVLRRADCMRSREEEEEQ